jgi:hypothetical protein
MLQIYQFAMHRRCSADGRWTRQYQVPAIGIAAFWLLLFEINLIGDGLTSPIRAGLRGNMPLAIFSNNDLRHSHYK